MLCTCNCMFVCFLSDLLIVSLKKNEKVGQLFCVCVFLFFSGIAPAILEAQTWSHFELGGKKRDKPLSPLPKCTSRKMHPHPILYTVNSSKDWLDKW